MDSAREKYEMIDSDHAGLVELHAGLVGLLIEKGIITLDEYGAVMLRSMERQVAELTRLHGTKAELR